ncbi:TetR/AcrR family transcriptional regulator [Streptomyces mayteni]
MARVSQEHLEARRQQILEGAARVFAREGFHGASMQEVLRETGLSAGAVYRYFPSKDALVAALAHRVLGVVRETFESVPVAEPPDLPAEIVRAMERVWTGLPFVPGLLPHVWVETLRNPELAAVMREGYGRLVEIWERLVETYQRNGWMRDDVPAQDVARTLLASVQGFMLQRVLFGNVEMEVLANGLRGLMSVDDDR